MLVARRPHNGKICHKLSRINIPCPAGPHTSAVMEHSFLMLLFIYESQRPLDSIYTAVLSNLKVKAYKSACMCQSHLHFLHYKIIFICTDEPKHDDHLPDMLFILHVPPKQSFKTCTIKDVLLHKCLFIIFTMSSC